MKISVIILTFNSQEYIEKTVRAAKKISDDVHAVDSYSSDETLNILSELKVDVVQHKFEHYGKQRNWAIKNVLCKYDWQLHLDSDEILSSELIREINGLAEEDSKVVGYFLPRMPAFLGRKIYYGGMFPVWHMRLFRKEFGYCEDRMYDQHFYVKGPTDKLTNPMVDYVCSNLYEWVNRHNKWSEAEVDELLLADDTGRIKPDLKGNPVERQRYLRGIYNNFPLFVRPFLLFFYRYFLRLGFLDGIEGLIFFFLKDFWFRFLIDAKLYEKKIQIRKVKRGSKS